MYVSRNIPVAVGTPIVVDLLGWPTPTTVTAVPGVSGSLTVEVSNTDTAVTDPAGASWFAWPSGVVTALTTNTMDSPARAMRVTATATAGRLELVA